MEKLIYIPENNYYLLIGTNGYLFNENIEKIAFLKNCFGYDFEDNRLILRDSYDYYSSPILSYEDTVQKAKEIVETMKNLGLRASLDAGEDKLGYRMRNAQVKKVPYTIVIGDHEKEEGTVTYRHFGCKAQHSVKFDEFVELLQKEIAYKSLPNYEE